VPINRGVRGTTPMAWFAGVAVAAVRPLRHPALYSS